MIEKMFMACSTNHETEGAMYGPFKTAGEAEKYAQQLGWTWVLVYTHTLDEYGHVIDVKTRFFQPDVREARMPGDIEAIRRMVVHVPPLTNDDIKFFERYETQMTGFNPYAETSDAKASGRTPDAKRR